MKVYDCFTFYNEFELLELRLKSLWNIVDYFVIVEADKNHTNKPKPFYFAERKEDFKNFLPKIRNIQLNVDIDYKGVGDWSIENGQRNSIIYGLSDAAPDDLIFISDADEIPAPDILQRIEKNKAQIIDFCPLVPSPDGRILKIPCQILIPASALLNHTPIAMNQNFHWYYFDWINSGIFWQGTILTKRKNLTTPQNLRNLRCAYSRVLDGGWHFTNMGGLKRVINKMISTVESDQKVLQSNNALIDEDHIRNCLKNGLDIWQRNRKDYVNLKLCDISQINLPYMEEFLKKYPYFLREYDFGKD